MLATAICMCVQAATVEKKQLQQPASQCIRHLLRGGGGWRAEGSPSGMLGPADFCGVPLPSTGPISTGGVVRATRHREERNPVMAGTTPWEFVCMRERYFGKNFGKNFGKERETEKTLRAVFSGQAGRSKMRDYMMTPEGPENSKKKIALDEVTRCRKLAVTTPTITSVGPVNYIQLYEH